MREYASWGALAIGGLVLLMIGIQGRLGLMIAAVFSPRSLKVRGEDDLSNSENERTVA